MSNTKNTRLYKAPVELTILIPKAGEVKATIRRNVYFRKSDGTPYIVVKGKRKNVGRKSNWEVAGSLSPARYTYTEVLQRSR